MYCRPVLTCFGPTHPIDSPVWLKVSTLDCAPLFWARFEMWFLLASNANDYHNVTDLFSNEHEVNLTSQCPCVASHAGKSERARKQTVSEHRARPSGPIFMVTMSDVLVPACCGCCPPLARSKAPYRHLACFSVLGHRPSL